MKLEPLQRNTHIYTQLQRRTIWLLRTSWKNISLRLRSIESWKLVSEKLKRNTVLEEVGTWANDTVMWSWSADTLFWQLSIDHDINVCIKFNTGYRLPYQLENVTFDIGFPVVWTDGRTDGRTATWPPKCFRCTDNQIFLPKVFCWQRESSAKNSSYAGVFKKNKLRKEKQL